MQDKYDDAVDFLTQHPDEIFGCWNTATHQRNSYAVGNPAILFAYAGTTPNCGCLTQVHGPLSAMAETKELEAAIRNDPRIPDDGEGITVELLPVFAEWQRRIDHYLETGELAV